MDNIARLEVFAKEHRQKLVTLVIAFFASIGSFFVLYHFLPYFSNHAVNLINMLINVINIFFFYQCFDLLHIASRVHPTSRWAQYGIEFSKIFLAFFLNGLITFHFILRPIFGMHNDPNYLVVVLIFSMPSTFIAAIIFELRRAKEVALQSRLAKAEAQYNLLEMQMQPHFLFNSLNVLSELIYVDPDLASSMTQQLADLYREILANSKNKFSSLSTEISILKKYIQIQKIRFGERIQFRSNIPMECEEIQVPSLILQTLVENAVKHGISPKKEGGEIEVSVVPKGSAYEISVTNTGVLYSDKKPVLKKPSQGTGLQNTKHRLDLIYGHSHGFTIFSDDKKTYVQFQVTGEESARTQTVFVPREEYV